MLDMGKEPLNKQKRIAVAAIALVAIVGISLVIVFTLPPGPSTPASYSKKVMFSEVQVHGSHADQFIELYTGDDPGSSLAGWKLVHGVKNITIPGINNLGKLAYVMLRFGPGTNDTDAADMDASIYFNTGLPFLELTGSLQLVDPLGRVVDFYHYGGAAPANPVDWLATDTGLALTGSPAESMQIWGLDQDGSSNWYINASTPGRANSIEFTEPNTATPIVVSNGINIDLPTSAGSDYEFLGGIVVKGNPAGWTSKEKIEEMAKFTVDYYAKKGFPTPYLGPDGKLDITIAAGNTTESVGSCNREGSIKINVGTTAGMAGNVSLKNTVEHEIMHAIQARIGGDGKHDHWANDANRPFTEGMAVWGGISSTMANYNLTWEQAMNYLKQAGDHNWFDHFRDLNNTAIPWGGSYDDYMNMGMFFKFLNETYGPGKIVQIMNGIKNYWNKSQGVDVTAQESIAAALGKSFDQVWRAYHEWLVNGSATAKNKFPPLTPHSSPAAPSSPTSPPVIDGPKRVQPYGGDIEFINCAGKTTRFNIGFGHLDGNTHWKITIIYTKPDGSKVTNWFSILGSVAPVPVDPTQWANITIIKTRIGETGNGSISITLTPVPPSSQRGSSYFDPARGNCSAANPTESTTTKLYDMPDSFFDVFFVVWIEASWNLTITARNTTGGPMQNYLGISVSSLNVSIPVFQVPFSPPETNPKEHTIHCAETTYYFIRVFWDDTIPGAGVPPPGSEIYVEMEFLYW